MAGFDPYYHWLSIPPEEQPPHHYRLLGVKAFEDNLDVIETAADRQMKHLRDYQAGKHGELSQKLLNEVAAAKVCLLDAQKKAAYDAQLQAKLDAASQAAKKKARQERPLAKATPLEPMSPAETNPLGPAQDFDPLRIGAPSPGATGGSPTRAASPTTGISPKLKRNLINLAIAGGAVLVLLIAGIFVVRAMMQEGSPVAVNEPHGNTSDGNLNPPPEGGTGGATGTMNGGTNTGNNTPSTQDPVPSTNPPSGPDPVDPTDPVIDPEEDPSDPTGEETIDETPVDIAEPPQLLPVPDKATRDAKRKQIAAIFPLDKVKTFEDKGDLAANLIRTSRETEGDPAAQFALLNLAREQAAEAGHIKLALEAVAELAAIFEFDADAVRATSFDAAAKATMPAAAKRELIDEGTLFIETLAASDDFDRAAALSDKLVTLARPLRDAELNKSLADQRRTTDAQAAEFRKAKAAFEKLKTAPADPDANLAAGRYLTFVKQDWDTGLGHLSKGSDAPLAAAAQSELADPQTPADKEKLAEAWWQAAEAQKDAQIKKLARARSGWWYSEIAADLTGLAKVKADQRIKEAGEITLGRRPVREPAHNEQLEVVYLDDLAEADFSVGWGELGKHGRVGYDKEDHNTFMGERPAHAISMVPKSDGNCHITYDLEGNCQTFETIAAQWDVSQRYQDVAYQSVTPLTFVVLGDGKELWKSKPSQKHGVGENCSVDVRGVRKLTLRVDCPGHHSAAWSVWINPRLTCSASQKQAFAFAALDLPGRFRAVHDWSHRAGYAGAFPTYDDATKNGQTRYGVIALKRDTATYAVVPEADLGSFGDIGQRFRAANDWGGKQGHGATFPNFHQDRSADGKLVHGVVYVKQADTGYLDVLAEDLGDPRGAEEALRAASQWAAKNGHAGAFLNFHQAALPDGRKVYGVRFFKRGAQRLELSAADLVGPGKRGTPKPRPIAREPASLKQDLVAHWAFDDAKGTVARDSAGKNDGKIKGATWTKGVEGAALSFDGKDDLVLIGNPDELNFEGHITLSAWIRQFSDPAPNSGGAVMKIITHGFTYEPYRSTFLRIVGDDGLGYQTGAWLGNEDHILSSPVRELKTWVHLVGTYDGDSWRLYCDGQQVAAKKSTQGATKVPDSWAIGAHPSRNMRHFHGDIDDVRIYNRALSAEEVAALFASTSGKAPPPAGNDDGRPDLGIFSRDPSELGNPPEGGLKLPPQTKLPPDAKLTPAGPGDAVMLYVDDGKVVGAAAPVHNPQLPHGVLVQWDNDQGAVVWHLVAPASGSYQLDLSCAVDPAEAGSTGRIVIGDVETGKATQFPFKAVASAGWNDYTTRAIGSIKLEKGRTYAVSLQAVARVKTHLMCFRWLRLTPAAAPLTKGKRILASSASYGCAGPEHAYQTTYTLRAPAAAALQRTALVFQLHGDRANDTTGDISISSDGSTWIKVGQWTPETIDQAAGSGYYQLLSLRDAGDAKAAAIQVKFERTSGQNSAEISGVAWVQE